MTVKDQDKPKLLDEALNLVENAARPNEWLEFLFEVQCQVMQGDLLEDLDEGSKRAITTKFRMLRNFFTVTEGLSE